MLLSSNVSRAWQGLKQRLVKAQIPTLRIHDCRHTYATLALESSVSIRWLSTQLGHAKTSTTLDIHAHALPREARDLGFADIADGITRHQAQPLAVADSGALAKPTSDITFPSVVPVAQMDRATVS